MESFLEKIRPVWSPHPGQRDFLLAAARTVVVACGRRWGKSDAAAVRTLAALHAEDGARTLVVAPTLDQARLIFDRVVELARSLREELGLFATEIVERRAPFPSLRVGEGVVDARSGHVGRHLRGREATDIVVDEAAFVEPGLVENVLWPMLATTGGRLTLLSTPNGYDGFHRLFRMGESGLSGVWSRRAPSSENPLVRPDFLALQRELTTERAYRREYEAEFAQADGTVFREELIVTARVGLDEPPAPGPVSVGVDWGRTRDHTAVVALCGSRERCTVETSTRVPNGPWEIQVPMVAEIVRRHPGASVACDVTGLGTGPTEQLQKALPGLAVRSIHIGAGEKLALIGGLVGLFETGAIRLRPDPLLEGELRDYAARESPTGHLVHAARTGHDDLVMALALAARDLCAGGYARPRRS